MIISRHYMDSDMLRFEVRKRDQLHEDVSGYLKLAGISTVTYTLMKKENLEVVGIVGLNVLWKGVAQVWLLTSDAARGCGVSYTKECIRLMDQEALRLSIRRIHIVVDAGIKENARWAKVLGFKYESSMKKAAPNGNDMNIYVYWPKGVNYGWRRTVSTAA